MNGGSFKKQESTRNSIFRNKYAIIVLILIILLVSSYLYQSSKNNILKKEVKSYEFELLRTYDSLIDYLTKQQIQVDDVTVRWNDALSSPDTSTDYNLLKEIYDDYVLKFNKFSEGVGIYDSIVSIDYDNPSIFSIINENVVNDKSELDRMMGVYVGNKITFQNYLGSITNQTYLIDNINKQQIQVDDAVIRWNDALGSPDTSTDYNLLKEIYDDYVLKFNKFNESVRVYNNITKIDNDELDGMIDVYNNNMLTFQNYLESIKT